jgi:hypothetical protein
MTQKYLQQRMVKLDISSTITYPQARTGLVSLPFSDISLFLLNITTQNQVIRKRRRLTDLPASDSNFVSHYGYGITEALDHSVVSAGYMETSIVTQELNVAAANGVEPRKVARTRSGDFYKEHNVAAVSSNLEINNGDCSSICRRTNELRG